MSGARAGRIVVVGNGIAGLTACDTLRDAGFEGELTVVGEELHAPYSRPALSKAALLDEGAMHSHTLPTPTHEATELLGRRAVQLDAERKVVSLDDGTTLPYDSLVVASGSRARRLTHAQPEGDVAELTVRTLDDALALRARLATAPTVVVVGDGALGMELASGCLASGCRVTLVPRGRPLLRQLGPHLSDVFTEAARHQGLNLAPAHATAVTAGDGMARVELADGSHVEAQLLVSAVGDEPNVAWLATSGLLTDGAARVDAHGRLHRDVVAVGDVATFPTRHGHRRMPLWTSALDQARAAGEWLVRGAEAAPLALQPYFWTEQFGLHLKASGFLPVAGEPELLAGTPQSGLLRWRHEDGSGTAVALNHRIPVPRLRRLSTGAEQPVRT